MAAQMRTDAYTKCRGAGHIGVDSSLKSKGRQIFLALREPWNTHPLQGSVEHLGL